MQRNLKKKRFGGPEGGPLDPERAFIQIPDASSSVALTATRFKPKENLRPMARNRPIDQIVMR